MTSESSSFCEFQSDQLLLQLDVTLAADIHAITPVVDRVIEMAREMNCLEGKEFEVETALREALANAIVHGCKEDSTKLVQFSVVCDKSRGILIVVRDPGPGFNLESLPSPVVGQNVFSSHGRGIFLINRLMDEVSVKHGGTGTEIHMRKK